MQGGGARHHQLARGVAPHHPRRRSTSLDPDGGGYELAGHVGPRPVERFDATAHRPFFERVNATRGASSRWSSSSASTPRAAPVPETRAESLTPSPRTLEQMNAALCIPASPAEDQVHRRARAQATSACARPTPPTRSSCSAASPRSIGDHAAELAALRAHEGARPPGRARRDGRRPGARDPQPARRHQGRGAAAAAAPASSAAPATRARAAVRGARVPRHHRRGGQPPQPDRLAVPRLRAPVPRRAAAARRQRGGAQDGAAGDAAAATERASDARRRRRSRCTCSSPTSCRPCAPTPSSCCRSSSTCR